MVMSVMLVVEATYNCAVSVGVKLLGWKPERQFKWEPLAGDGDEEKGDGDAAAAAAYPMVMVQIPMYNELENFTVNDRASLLTRTQKTFLDYQFKVEQEAGSATFAFFSFNGTAFDKKNLSVKKQNYVHHQEKRHANFLGTAGVWRREAIDDAGGWKDRTTVEDMDLAVRATLKGWKFIYVGDVRVKSELPSTYQAYCGQQFRWACGSANLFRKMTWEVMVAKQVSPLKKFYIIYSFFLARRVIAPTVAFVLYNIIIPVSVMIPEVFLPVWGVAYIPTALTVVTAIRNPELAPLTCNLHYSYSSDMLLIPSSMDIEVLTVLLLYCIMLCRNLHIMPLWILFESVMSMHRLKAAVANLLELPEFNQWIVTQKVGNNGAEENCEVPLLQKARKGLRNRVNVPETGFSVFLFICASYNLVFRGKTSYFINLYLQGLAFFLLGLNCIGTSCCCL
ncbi:putative mannan synthase 5 [Dichanthelium oligosanthes]|uniref:Putative mannan synthase 5 n=1 Tax=Dichanthelium oligosanthes TaxID=888268 RepID=A0A1E5WIH0_9POAL|nr:putative mannan synthase 5 [Dichanthelium oligosanthes]